MQHKTAFGAVAAMSAAAGMLLSAVPASAQEVPTIGPDSCETGVLSYPPGLTAGVPTISNVTPAAGEVIEASSGADRFDAGSPVVVTLDLDVATLGTVTAGPDGAATISRPLPTALQPGTHVVVFTGTLGGLPSIVGVCVASTGAGTPITGSPQDPSTGEEPDVVAVPITGVDQTPAERPSTLPFTGSVELVAVAGLGAALVALGAGTVVVARRRRDETPLAV